MSGGLVRARVALVAVSIGFITACSKGTAGSPENAPTPAVQTVRIATASEGEIHPALQLAGAVAPSQTVALSNALSEPAASVYVKEGDRVRAGQALADLDVDDLQAQLQSALGTARANDARSAESSYNAQLAYAQAPNQVRQARAQLAQAQATLVEAERNQARLDGLVRQGYLPQLNLDEQRTVVRNDEQAVVQGEAALQVALATQRVDGNGSAGLQAVTVAAAREDAAAQRATAEQIRRQISRAHIVSPVDGVVVNRNLNPGEYPSGRQIFTIEANETMFAVLTASAVQAYQIHAGDAVSVTIPGLGSARFRGSVAAVLDAATPGSTNFTVKVAIPNRDGRLRAGTPVAGIVALAPVRGIVVPSSAFANDQRSQVAVVRDGRARNVRVNEIATDGYNSIVSGLQPGERVVRDGSQSLDDGERVAAR